MKKIFALKDARRETRGWLFSIWLKENSTKRKVGFGSVSPFDYEDDVIYTIDEEIKLTYNQKRRLKTLFNREDNIKRHCHGFGECKSIKLDDNKELYLLDEKELIVGYKLLLVDSDTFEYQAVGFCVVIDSEKTILVKTNKNIKFSEEVKEQLKEQIFDIHCIGYATNWSTTLYTPGVKLF